MILPELGPGRAYRKNVMPSTAPSVSGASCRVQPIIGRSHGLGFFSPIHLKDEKPARAGSIGNCRVE